MVSLIILSYNTSKLLHDCLISVEEVLGNSEYEVIVVDNASHDDSVAMLKRDFPNATLIESKENVGFARGCNLGTAQAKGEYLLFLNSDTVLRENPLPEMLSFFEKDEKVGIVGGSLKNSNGTQQRSYGSFYGLPQIALMLFGGEKAELKVQSTEKPREVDWVSGGFMMVRKSVFTLLHGFDGRFFMYIEDMELCYRAKKKGFGVIHTPNAVVYHIGQGSSNKSFAVIRIFQGLRIFYKKHRGSLAYAMLLCLLTMKAWAAMIIGLFRKDHYLVDTYRKALTA